MARLGDVCDVFAGQGAPQGANNYCDSKNGIPFIKAGDLSDLLSGKLECEIQCVTYDVAQKHKLKLYPAGSILFAKSGMSCMKGYVYRVQNPSYVVSHLAILVPKKIDGEYLRFYLEFHKPNSLIKDSAYPSISLQDISNMELNVPCLEKQKEFANNLQRINELITYRKQQLSTLDDIVKSRFVELFDNNDFPTVLFEDVCAFLRNGANIKQTKGAGGYPITRIETLSNDVFNIDRLGYANITDLEKYQNYVLRNGDILISHINSVAYLGRAVQYRGQLNSPIIHGMNLLCARIVDSFNPTYIEWYFKTPMAKEYISTITKKAVNQASITTSDLKKMVVPNPPIEMQDQFAAFVEQTDKLKFDNLSWLLKVRRFLYKYRCLGVCL